MEWANLNPLNWKRHNWYQARVFFLTFMCYVILCICRNPFSIAKSSLRPNDGVTEGYAPFDDPGGTIYMGLLDTAFLGGYAFGLFFSGQIGDKFGNRILLSNGMILVGIFCILFGLGAPLGIHSLLYFVMIQVLGGLAQSCGWPGCIATMSPWFAQRIRGFVFGVWSAHQNIGNALGKVLITLVNVDGWSNGFYMAGMFAIVGGVMLWVFLVNRPEEVGLESAQDVDETRPLAHPTPIRSPSTRVVPLLIQTESGRFSPSGQPLASPSSASSTPTLNMDNDGAISFLEAIKVPGIIQYALSLFCAKFTTYMFMFWLPYYLYVIHYTKSEAGNFATLFDFGCLLGSILVGYVSDKVGRRALVAGVFSILACISLYLFYYASWVYGNRSLDIIMLIVVGIFVNSPYSLISTACCADLGSSPHLRGKGRAIATVTGIIDGTGSMGAALQGIVVAAVSNSLGWDSVYYIMIAIQFGSLLLTVNLIIDDIRIIKNREKPPRDENVEVKS